MLGSALCTAVFILFKNKNYKKGEHTMKTLKKALLIVMSLALCFALAACGADKGEGPEIPAAEEREALMVYLDGQLVKEGGYTFAELDEVMVNKNVEGTYYYSADLAAITGQDLSGVKAVFVEAADGFIGYSADVTKTFVAAYVSDESGAYKSVEVDGKKLYGGLFEGEKYIEGVTKVYLSTTACDWEVDVQVDGKSVGKLTMADFMHKTTVGEDKKAPTAMFDGSYKYDGGSATYTGKFLGMKLDQLIAKLGTDMELAIPEEYIEVEIYGATAANDKIGKNKEYKTEEASDKYFGLLEFYVMYDGMTKSSTSGMDIGLTAFINGTGSRWMTHGVEIINFVTEAPAAE